MQNQMTTVTVDDGSAVQAREPLLSVGAVRRKAPIAKQKILIIEDDKAMHSLYKVILKDRRYTFISAYEGAVGLAIAEATEPDLILLDVDLPGVTGFFICKYLKTHPLTASVPVIFISGLTSAEDMVCGLEAEASDYVTKPVNHDDLRIRVEGALRTKRTMESIAAGSPMTLPRSRRTRPSRRRPDDANMRSKLREAKMNPWTRIGQVVDEMAQHFHGTGRRST